MATLRHVKNHISLQSTNTVERNRQSFWSFRIVLENSVGVLGGWDPVYEFLFRIYFH